MATSHTGAPDAGDGFVVRRVRQDEWRELRALRLRALADAPDAFGATLAEAEAEPDEAWQERAAAARVTLVAEVDGRLVGMAAGGTAPIDPSSAALYSMWVEPDHRGTGVASAIVGAIVDWATGAGYQGLGLGVTTTNARAIAFYERLGFVDNGMRFPLREGADLEIQIMIRPLAEDR